MFGVDVPLMPMKEKDATWVNFMNLGGSRQREDTDVTDQGPSAVAAGNSGKESIALLCRCLKDPIARRNSLAFFGPSSDSHFVLPRNGTDLLVLSHQSQSPLMECVSTPFCT